MAGLTRHVVRHWQYRAAVRAEHCLEPTWRRRLDRIPQRWADRMALRAERRSRPTDFTARMHEATERSWGAGW